MTATHAGFSAAHPGDVRAVFFDAGFTLIFPTRPVVDLYVEAARAVSQSHCDTRLREAFARTWAAGTRDDPGDHRSSDSIERMRWHRFTLRVAEAIPELLPHHAAWLERLAGTFDCGDGWRLAPEAPEILRAAPRPRAQARDREQLAWGTPSDRLRRGTRGARRLRRRLRRRGIPQAAPGDLPGCACGRAESRRRPSCTSETRGTRTWSALSPPGSLPSTSRTAWVRPSTRDGHHTITDLSELTKIF